MTTKTKKLKPVTSIFDLKSKAQIDPRYFQLALDSAANLGLSITPRTGLDEAINWLIMNANETDSEEGVVDEINFCR